MDQAWVSALPAFAVAASVFILPGLVVRLAGWDVRSIGPYLFAPAISVAIVAVASNLASLARVPWSLLPIVVVTAVAAAAAFFVKRAIAPAPTVRPSRVAVAGVAGGFFLAAVLLAWQLTYVFVGPANISQTFDNIVHLNAIRLALDTGDAGAFQIGATSDIGFYPNAWHSFVTIAAELTSSSIPVAVNATNIAIGAIVWPASVMALAGALFRDRTAALVSAAALSTAFGAFPILLMSFGVLYPNATGYAVLPAGLAAVWLLLESRGADRWRASVLLLVVSGAIGLGHPNAFLALFAMAVPQVLVWLLIDAIRARSARRWVIDSGIAVALLATGAILWRFARTGSAMSQWGPWTGPWQALLEGLLVSPRSYTVTAVTALLVLAGVVAAIMRPRQLLALVPFGVALFMFVLVSGTGYGLFRDMVTNPWYNDSFRLAALLPIAGIPVATMGAVAIVDLASRLARRRSIPTLLRGLVTATATLVLFSVAFGPNVQSAATAARASYVLSDSSALLTADEEALLSRLDTTTPEDALILGNPWTGTALAFGLGGREVVTRHIFGERTPSETYLDTHFREIESDPAVCDAVRDVGATYVLDFGGQNVFNDPNAGVDRAGLNDLQPSGALVLVDSEGDAARLFRIAGC